MNILLYNPDNQVTKNYMPHLWMFVLQAVTPPGHKVFLIDGNAQSMTEESIAEFVRENSIELAGIGAMTRMAARAYRMADAIRAAGAKVVMGGPHVTEVPYEPIGLDGEPRHADAVALGEADYLWPQIVRDAEAGNLQEVYKPVDESGVGGEAVPRRLPPHSLGDDGPDAVRPGRQGPGVGALSAGEGRQHLEEPIRGADRVRPRLPVRLRLLYGDRVLRRLDPLPVQREAWLTRSCASRPRAAKEGGKVGVFFIDDNFAINKKRTKSLLRAMIENGAQVPWVAQISMNLLKDEELCDLIKESGGRWIFMGLESIDTASLKDVNKGFNKPDQYREVLERLASRGIYSITSFIFGMDGDRPGVAQKTLDAIAEWPPGLPVYGLMTPYPATPLYDRLFEQGRLTRPKHWLDFRPFRMAYTPENISIDQAEAEVDQAWTESYAPETTARALRQIEGRPFHERAVMFFTRLAFRGIYFPQMTKRHWITLLWNNRESFAKILFEAYQLHRRHRRGDSDPPVPERVAERKRERVAA